MINLTPAQKTTLKNSINADPVLSLLDPDNSDHNEQIAVAYNLPATPSFTVWRTSLSKAEILRGTSTVGNFLWAASGFVGRNVSELMAWQEMFSVDDTINPSLPSIRQGILDIFSGTGNAVNNRDHIAALGKRLCTRFERLYTTGVGSIASPATMALGTEGPLDRDTVQAARKS